MNPVRNKPRPTDSYQESIRDKLNLSENIYRHLDRMSAIITNPQLDESRYNWAIEHMRILLEPYTTGTQYEKNVKKIENDYEKKIKNAKTTAEEKRLILEKNRMILKELSNLIKNLRLGLELQGEEEI